VLIVHTIIYKGVLVNLKKEGLPKKNISSREILQILSEDGWYIVRIEGDHYQLKHPVKKGLVTVKHPTKTLDKKLIHWIYQQAGLHN